MATSPGLFLPSIGENNAGCVDFSFSFLTAATGVDPDATLIRGNKVASVTRSAAGKYLVTLDSPYYQIISRSSIVDDVSTGDGAYASVYVADEAASPLVLTVFTYAAGGAKTDLVSRRVNVDLKIRLSVGA